jgi:hypothetical protein
LDQDLKCPSTLNKNFKYPSLLKQDAVASASLLKPKYPSLLDTSKYPGPSDTSQKHSNIPSKDANYSSLLNQDVSLSVAKTTATYVARASDSFTSSGRGGYTANLIGQSSTYASTVWKPTQGTTTHGSAYGGFKGSASGYDSSNDAVDTGYNYSGNQTYGTNIPPTSYASQTNYTTQKSYTAQINYGAQTNHTSQKGYTPETSYTPQAGYTQQTNYAPKTSYAPLTGYTALGYSATPSVTYSATPSVATAPKAAPAMDTWHAYTPDPYSGGSEHKRGYAEATYGGAVEKGAHAAYGGPVEKSVQAYGAKQSAYTAMTPYQGSASTDESYGVPGNAYDNTWGYQSGGGYTSAAIVPAVTVTTVHSDTAEWSTSAPTNTSAAQSEYAGYYTSGMDGTGYEYAAGGTDDHAGGAYETAADSYYTNYQ